MRTINVINKNIHGLAVRRESYGLSIDPEVMMDFKKICQFNKLNYMLEIENLMKKFVQETEVKKV